MQIGNTFRRRWLAVAAVGICSVLLVLSIQSWRNAWHDDFGSSYDEPAHYMMVLTAHDYLAQPLQSWPVPFAELYYLHYPKLAFGHWPPLFHLVAGAWMLLAGTSRTAVLVLLALITGASSVVLYRAAVGRMHWISAAAIAILLPLLPLSYELYSMVMLEVPCALLSFLALVCLARLLEENTYRWAMWFAFWTSAAIMTKQNGWALGMVPLFAMAIVRDFRLLRQAKLWLSGGLILLCCVPFYAAFFSAVSAGADSVGHHDAFFYALKGLPLAVGLPIAIFAAIGVAVEVLVPLLRRSRVEWLWAVMLAAPLSTLLLFSLAPGSLELRHLFFFAMPALMFAGRGLEAAAGLLAARSFSLPAARIASAACLLALFFSFSFRPRPVHCDSFTRLAAYAQTHLDGAVYLISSSENGEGRFIADFAASETVRPGRILLRGSKQLASNNWLGNRYKAKYTDAARLEQALDEAPVSVLVLHHVAGSQMELHQQLLQQVVARNPGAWRLAYHERHLCQKHGIEEVAVYENAANRGKATSSIQVDLSDKLKLKYSLSELRGKS